MLLFSNLAFLSTLATKLDVYIKATCMSHQNSQILNLKIIVFKLKSASGTQTS